MKLPNVKQRRVVSLYIRIVVVAPLTTTNRGQILLRVKYSLFHFVTDIYIMRITDVI